MILDGLIIIPCACCGGDGGFTYPVTFDPFTGAIGEQTMTCRECGGSGEEEIETFPLELADLDALSHSLINTPPSQDMHR